MEHWHKYVVTNYLSFVMFVTGAVTGAATNARAWSAYLDSLCHNCIANYTLLHNFTLPHYELLSQYPDLISAFILILVTIVVSIGVKCSAHFNGIFAGCNVAILVFFSIVGFVYAEPSNWENFFAFGWRGILQASGACFWAFSGFEAVVTSIEEAKNPKRDITLATFLSLFIVVVLYIATSASLTLVAGYQSLDSEAPLPTALNSRGLVWAHYIIAFGPLCGLATTLLNCIFGFARTCYAMAQDGLLSPAFSYVPGCSKVPVVPTVICGCLSILLAVFVDIREIIAFGINVTILNYMLVNVALIVMRYQTSPTHSGYIKLENMSEPLGQEATQIPDFGSRKVLLEALLPSDVDDEEVKNGDIMEEVAERDARIEWVEHNSGNGEKEADWAVGGDNASKENLSNEFAEDNEENIVLSANKQKRALKFYCGMLFSTLPTMFALLLVIISISLAAVLLHGFKLIQEGNLVIIIVSAFLFTLMALLLILYRILFKQNNDPQPFRVR